MAKEYERRFLIEALPEGEPLDDVLIRQVYWRLGKGWSLRLRRLGSDQASEDFIALKGPRHGSERWEFEYRFATADMTPQERDERLGAVLNLYNAGAEHSVVKKRRSYVIDGIAWDIDEFLWDNEGLIIAEVEMQDQQSVLDVRAPKWATREVTLDARFNNENLAYEPYARMRFDV